jgi:hypothetical protein
MGAPSSVLQVTLQLLPAPTKALVGSALIAAGAELWRSSNNPARCFEYRQPYDDDVFGVIATLAGAMHEACQACPRPAAPLARPAGPFPRRRAPIIEQPQPRRRRQGPGERRGAPGRRGAAPFALAAQRPDGAAAPLPAAEAHRHGRTVEAGQPEQHLPHAGAQVSDPALLPLHRWSAFPAAVTCVLAS